MRYEIIRRLKNTAGGYVSGADLGRMLGVSRTAVWKQIMELRKEGYAVEGSSRKGYRLVSSENMLNAFEITDGLGTVIVGREAVYLDSTGSTNDYAKKLAAEGCAEGLAVVADRQTSGKGRLGRSWFSPPGKSISMSIVLRPPMAPAEAQVLALAASVAAAEAIRAVTGVRAGIKWPNDIVIDGKKACGILLEMSSEPDGINYVVLGIGINYSHDVRDFPAELADRAISLKMAVEGKNGGSAGLPSKLSVIRAVLVQLDGTVKMILEGRQEEVLEIWRKYSITLGREVSFLLKGVEYTGTAVDIAPDGRLLVDCADGVRRGLFAGEISIRGICGYA